jgi:hypothetical protein
VKLAFSAVHAFGVLAGDAMRASRRRGNTQGTLRSSKGAIEGETEGKGEEREGRGKRRTGKRVKQLSFNSVERSMYLN